jgi:hypothetical protein
MANIFGILTAVLLALAAFVAYKNKDAYQAEVDHRKHEEAQLATSRERLATAQTNLKNTEGELVSTREAIVKLRATEEGHKKTNADLQNQIDSKTQQRDSNKTRLTEIEAKLADLGNIKELVGKVQAMAAAIEESKQAIADNETKLANLNTENARTTEFIQKLQKEGTMFANKQSYFRSASITSIYPGYGFVTLGAGSSSGVVSGSVLDVVRSGQVVAKLLVSTVESNHASASIIPDSLAPDTVLMVGDKVEPAVKAVEAPAKPELPVPAPGDGAPALDDPAADPAPAAIPADPFGTPAAGEPAETPAEAPAEESPF